MSMALIGFGILLAFIGALQQIALIKRLEKNAANAAVALSKARTQRDRAKAQYAFLKAKYEDERAVINLPAGVRIYRLTYSADEDRSKRCFLTLERKCLLGAAHAATWKEARNGALEMLNQHRLLAMNDYREKFIGGFDENAKR